MAFGKRGAPMGNKNAAGKHSSTGVHNGMPNASLHSGFNPHTKSTLDALHSGVKKSGSYSAHANYADALSKVAKTVKDHQMAKNAHIAAGEAAYAKYGNTGGYTRHHQDQHDHHSRAIKGEKEPKAWSL